MSNLKPQELKEVKKAEQQLQNKLGEDVALIAWKDKNKDKNDIRDNNKQGLV
jgi:hypothetical protein